MAIAIASLAIASLAIVNVAIMSLAPHPHQLEVAAAAKHGDKLPSTRHLKEGAKRAAGLVAQGALLLLLLEPSLGADCRLNPPLLPHDLHPSPLLPSTVPPHLPSHSHGFRRYAHARPCTASHPHPPTSPNPTLNPQPSTLNPNPKPEPEPEPKPDFTWSRRGDDGRATGAAR